MAILQVPVVNAAALGYTVAVEVLAAGDGDWAPCPPCCKSNCSVCWQVTHQREICSNFGVFKSFSVLGREELEFRGNVKHEISLRVRHCLSTLASERQSPETVTSMARTGQGYGLAQDTTCKQAVSLGRMTKVRLVQLVAERVQVEDVGGDLADSVTQTLDLGGPQSVCIVALRFGSTQRTAWYTEAKGGGKRGQGKGEIAATKVSKA
eukprot:2466560-Pleurochrysis_carterae.AAC.1